MIPINFMLIYLNLCSTKCIFRAQSYDLDTWFSHFHNKFIIEVNFSSFWANFQSRAELKKIPSRAELKILQLVLWLEPARFGLIITKYIVGGTQKGIPSKTLIAFTDTRYCLDFFLKLFFYAYKSCGHDPI